MHEQRIHLIGVPLDLGAGHRGVDMGPSAIRVTGLDERLRELGHHVEDRGNISTGVRESIGQGDPTLRFFEPILQTNAQLADAVCDALRDGAFPVVLGGDHSVAIGSIAGAATCLAEQDRALGVIWIDAHADMNTPETSPSGNIHGMSLAVSLGSGPAPFVDLLTPGPKVLPQNVALIAARDLDAPERDHLRDRGIHVYTMRNIDERGMFAIMTDAIADVTRDTDGVYVQFDMDAIDPHVAPGTGTPVPGGLSYREAHLAMEMLADEAGHVIALDIVETNPALDLRNQTAQLATELVLSLLGKTIYRHPGAPSLPGVGDGCPQTEPRP